jgi:hypothetical protein
MSEFQIICITAAGMAGLMTLGTVAMAIGWWLGGRAK